MDISIDATSKLLKHLPLPTAFLITSVLTNNVTVSRPFNLTQLKHVNLGVLLNTVDKTVVQFKQIGKLLKMFDKHSITLRFI